MDRRVGFARLRCLQDGTEPDGQELDRSSHRGTFITMNEQRCPSRFVQYQAEPRAASDIYARLGMV
jgi:hypothetical protein